MYCNRVTKGVLLLCCSLISAANFASEKPRLALVIDDLGYSLDYGKQALNLAGNNTYAIIPNSPYAQKLAKLAINAQKEVIMHLPMQPNAHNIKSESSTLNDRMNEQKIIDTTQQFLAQMPYIAGVNNHMGSHLTQYAYFMRPVMETIYHFNPKLYFLDSRTSAKSKAYAVALHAGLKSTKRSVFLDHSSAAADIRYQFKLWLEKAEQGKNAIAIAHPIKSTLEVVAPLLKQAQNNYQFVPVSQYINPKQESPQWPMYLSHLHKDAKTSKQ